MPRPLKFLGLVAGALILGGVAATVIFTVEVGVALLAAGL